MVAALDSAERRRRAARVKLVVSDVDGVLTDAGVYYSARGEELKRFSLRDGMGVELLRDAGIDTAFMTREASPIVARRARKLGLRHVYLGVRDKADALDVVVKGAETPIESIAYIGDDVNDLEVLRRIAEAGLTAAPADANREVKAVVDFITEARGGHGAFREFADSILQWRETKENL